MAITSETSEVSYTGNGATTAFSVPFMFFENGDLVVEEKPSGGSYATLTLGVHYTLTGAGEAAGGTLTRTTAPATGATLRIRRTVDVVQETAFRTHGSFSPATHEDALDYRTMVDQQMARDIAQLQADVAAAELGNTTIGAGLLVTSGVLDVGAGNGIIVNADDIEVDPAVVALAADYVKKAGDTMSGQLALEAVGSVLRFGASAQGRIRQDGNGVWYMTNVVYRDDLAEWHREDTAKPCALLILHHAGNARMEFRSALAGANPVVWDYPITVSPSTQVANFAVTPTVAGSTVWHAGNAAKSSAAPQPLGVAAAGSSADVSRADHVHTHGNQAGGSLHSVATTAAAGFMSAADKTKSDGLGDTYTGTVTTTDATATTVLAITPADGEVVTAEVLVAGRKSDGTQGAGYKIGLTARRSGATTSAISSMTALWNHEDDIAWDVEATLSGTDILVRVIGVAATTINWRARAIVCRVS